ncbi:hypothetical protein [Clavibacter michiganensis]|uniref:hypothetical protein n=1 Tax=Clavibacter michiganensis TaxID=28447 RepID=UPI0011AFE95D|nr:hypothetical protein [Clavibacter michiganensis]
MTSSAVACVASNGLTGSSIALHWVGVVPAAAGAPAAAYDYQLTFVDRNNGRVVNTVTVPHSGASGSAQTYSVTSGTFSNLLGLNILSQNRISTQIQSRLRGTAWYGTSVVSINWTTVTVLAVTTFNCV